MSTSVSHDGSVRTDVQAGVAWIEIDRAHRRNSLTGPLVESLLEALRSTRSLTNVILLTGAGDHLCAGLDIDAFNANPAPPWRAGFGALWAELHTELWAEHRPLVVAHRGAAVGAGSALVFAGDVVIAGRSAYAHVVEASMGMLAPINLAWLVARHSAAVAAELSLLAERQPAERLLAKGLVAEVVDDDEVVGRARDRAERIAGLPPAAIAATRAAVRELSGVDFASTIAAAQAHSPAFASPKRDAR